MTGSGDTVWAGTKDGGVVRWTLPDSGSIRFTKKNGLCGLTIFSIKQGPDGVVWAGTESGICRYNGGEQWQAYTSTQSGTVGKVIELAVNTGIVAAATSHGFCVWRNGGFASIDPIVDGSTGFTVENLSISNDGEIWISSAAKLARGKNEAFFSVPLPVECGENSIIDISAEENGGVWITTGSNVCQYSDSGWNIYTANTTELAHQIITIALDDSLGIWGAGWNGLSRFSNGTWTRVVSSLVGNPVQIHILSSATVGICLNGPVMWWDGKYLNTIKATGLENNDIRYCFVDGEDNLWAVPYANKDGISRYNSNTWSTLSTYTSGLIHNSVTAMTVDSQQTLWYGTGFGVSRNDNGTWTKFQAKNGLSLPRFQDMITSSDGTVWAACYGGVLYFNNNTWFTYTADSSFLPGNDVRSIIQTTDGTIWVGTQNGIAYLSEDRFITPLSDDANGPGTVIHSLAAEKDGGLLVAGNNGCSRFMNDKWEKLVSDVGTCSDILIDGQSRIWIATQQQGIAVFDNQGTPVKHFTEKEGLNSNVVYSLAASYHGTIWAATNRGLAEIFLPLIEPPVEYNPISIVTMPRATTSSHVNNVNALGRQLPSGRHISSGLKIYSNQRKTHISIE